MQLYKSRGFGQYFGDTFTFIKLNGRHFFKHYFIVTGVFLLILLVLFYFFMKFYREFLFGVMDTNNPNMIENYVSDNAGLFVLLGIILLAVALVAGMISYAFTPIYLKLYEKFSGQNFETKDIIEEYKNNIGRLALYLTISLFFLVVTFSVLALIIFGVGSMMSTGLAVFLILFALLGIFLIPFLAGLLMLFFGGTLIEFIEGKKGVFECFGYAWELIKLKFWPSIASVGIFYLMSYIVQQIVTMIPYIFGMASMFTTIETSSPGNQKEFLDGFTLIMMMVFFLSFIVGVFLNNIVQLNQGIVFYSLKEEKENINTKSDIDLIGSGE